MPLIAISAAGVGDQLYVDRGGMDCGHGHDEGIERNGSGRRHQMRRCGADLCGAVSMAAVPIWIHFARDRQQQKQTQDRNFEEQERKFGKRIPTKRQPDAQPSPRAERASSGLGEMAGNGGTIIGLASPFIELTRQFLVWGVMGLLILFWGMRIAWRITAGQAV